MVSGGALEGVAVSALPCEDFWAGQRVFLTGHTGFKGGWAAVWLKALGAEVCGYALPPPQGPSLFEALDLSGRIASVYGDIRDPAALQRAFEQFRPTIVLHLAAQPLVRAAYADPVATYATNVLGLVNLLELVRATPGVRATVVVTTDKCYENREQIWPYREIDALGGRDPYSNSKACAELVVSGYWWSYFQGLAGQGLATARAGNVVGGGDWSKDRLVPDLISAFSEGRPAVLRRPEGVRPWQHVIEPLCGYFRIAEHLARAPQSDAPQSWNFGPEAAGNVRVEVVARKLAHAWGEGAGYLVEREPNPVHEATLLALDSTKAEQELGWRPRWNLDETVKATADWYRAYSRGEDMYSVTRRQLAAYAAA